MDLSGLTTEESFAKLDREISVLEQKLWTLRHLRNSIPPISSIPPEVLCKIFLICHDQNIQRDPDGTSLGADMVHLGKTRLILSWVSQHWRQVALSYAKLWAFVTKGNVDYIRSCLDRSKRLHLAVDLLDPHQAHVREALDPMHRIRSLHIDIARTPRSTDIDPDRVWEQPAPQLVSLSVEHISLDGNDPEDTTPLFSGSHPRLQHLTITLCGFQWDSSLLLAAPLTTLHVISPDRRITVDSLIKTLQAIPSLIDCKLVMCLQPITENSLTIEQVHIPSLKSFHLQDRLLSEPVVLLSGLDLPNSSIDLKINVYKPSLAAVMNMFQLLEGYWDEGHQWKNESIHHISVDCSDHKVNLNLSTPPNESRQFTLDFVFGDYDDDMTSLLTRLVRFTRCNPRGLFLNTVAREVVYLFAKFTKPRIVHIKNILPLEPGAPAQEDHDTSRSVDIGHEELFQDLEELEVDGKRCPGLEFLLTNNVSESIGDSALVS